IFCKDLAQAFRITSTDDGATFQAPVEITETFRKFPVAWKFFATGHSHGIQLASGRLAVPVFLSEVPRTGGFKRDKFHVGVIYSDDRGARWQEGGLVPDGDLLSENTIFERADGSLVLNARATGLHHRAVAYSTDAG